MNYISASILERIIKILRYKTNEVIVNGRTKFNKLINMVIRIHMALKKEDKVIVLIRSIVIIIQKIQSSLEDSLSTQSLLLEFLSILSIIVTLVFIL